MKQFNNTQRLTISAVSIAMYLALMIGTQGFAFGQYQVRIATALYGLSAIFPFTIPAFTIANFVSNTVMGGFGLVDSIGGAIVGLLTTGLIVLAKRQGLGNWVLIPIITFVPGLIVPIWLTYFLPVPYWVLVSSLVVGQFVCGVVSYFLINALEKVVYKNKEVLVRE
ncbi:QueT transporter family protein [Veillonella sp. CHU732]|uniref:QueT transporter family protein n=1 Tax=Veillonella sp. CHU732 TaxID=2490949 RepID=UPI000F8E49BF|nr:QueT transporter family protein [Veillonella sp. CHU732]